MGQNIQKKFNAAQNEIRIAIMNFVINNKKAFNITLDGFSALDGPKLSRQSDFMEIIDALGKKDGIVADETGNINFVYPVSALPTRHRVRLADGREFTAMCAIDALGAAFTFEQDSEVFSNCSVCEQSIYVQLCAGKVVKAIPGDLRVLSFELDEIVNWAGSC